MMPDAFEEHMSALNSPATRHFAITPNDSTDLVDTPRAIFCGSGGTVNIEDQSGNPVTYTVQAGQYLLIRAKRVRSAGTSATGLVGVY